MHMNFFRRRVSMFECVCVGRLHLGLYKNEMRRKIICVSIKMQRAQRKMPEKEHADFA